jgi:MFS family permease
VATYCDSKGISCGCLEISAHAALLYSVVFLQTIGIKDTYQITVLLYVVNLAAAGLAFYAADRLGRRYLLLGAACVMAACMYAVAGITGYDSNPESIKGALACLFIWQFAQALGWSSW